MATAPTAPSADRAASWGDRGNQAGGWRPWGAGLLAAVIVLAAGVGYVATRPKTWSANTTVVVVPDKSLALPTASSYFDTLSSGQVPSTVGQVLDVARYKTDAASKLGLTRSVLSEVSVVTTVVTGTFLVKVTVTAPMKIVAEDMADQVVAAATPQVNNLIAPYQMSVVSSSSGSGVATSSLGSTKFFLVLLIVALAVGIGLQQAVVQFSSGIRSERSRRHRPRARRRQPEFPPTDESGGPPVTTAAAPDKSSIEETDDRRSTERGARVTTPRAGRDSSKRPVAASSFARGAPKPSVRTSPAKPKRSSARES